MSLNAVKHGLTSTKMFVLQNENPAAWAELLDQCVKDYKPTTPLEHTYVQAIAFSLWRLRRMYSVQTAMVDLEMDDPSAGFNKNYETADETVRKTLAVRELLSDARPLTNLSRYEVALQRAHDRAVNNLVNLRKLRNEKPGLTPTHCHPD